MLFLASKLFAAVTNLRGFASEFGIISSYQSKLPVICIGNAVVGGAGKTPTVRWVCGELKARGYRPVVLSRGYKGSEVGPYECSPEDLAVKIGDEPALLVRSGCRVVVSKDKVAGAKFIEAGIGDVIVLDDGYQHLRLGRDCNILVVPGGAKLDEPTLPAGRLRETYPTALSRADAVLIANKSNLNQSESVDLARHISELSPSVLVGSSHFSHAVIVSSNGEPVCDCCEACLVTAVASPDSVRATALAAGVKVVSEHFFPDHYQFRASDFEGLRKSSDLPILVTEKDAVKLLDIGIKDFLVLKVSLVVCGGLLDLMLSRISAKIRQPAEQSELCNQILAASPLKRQKLAELRRVCRDFQGNVLDLGSDNGAVSFALRRLGGAWCTGDLDADVVAGAKYFLGESVREVNPVQLPFDAGAFDAVAVLDMFEHLQDDVALRREIVRVLKPGGSLVVNVPNPHPGLVRMLRFLLGQNDEVHGHLRPGYTPAQLQKLLGDEFQVEVVREYSRIFTEIADTIVTLGVDLLKSAKRSSAKGRVVSAGNLVALKKTVKLGRIVAPLLNLALLFDFIFPWSNANLLIIRARKKAV